MLFDSHRLLRCGGIVKDVASAGKYIEILVDTVLDNGLRAID